MYCTNIIAEGRVLHEKLLHNVIHNYLRFQWLNNNMLLNQAFKQFFLSYYGITIFFNKNYDNWLNVNLLCTIKNKTHMQIEFIDKPYFSIS